MAKSTSSAFGGEFIILRDHCDRNCEKQIGHLEVKYSCPSLPWTCEMEYREFGIVQTCNWNGGNRKQDLGTACRWGKREEIRGKRRKVKGGYLSLTDEVSKDIHLETPTFSHEYYNDTM